jgi:UDP-N-acetyl-D-mannosaminuronic acid dehydrogenase
VTLAERVRRREATVAVVGLGRVGLPLGIALADSGLTVRGVEVDDQRRTSIELGKMPFHEAGADELLRRVVAEGRFTVWASPAGAVDAADVAILCVGTPLGTDLRPDYGQLRRALDLIAPHLRRNQLVIQRSTVSPGTLQKVVRPFLARRRPDLAGTLLLAACPERIAEGRALAEMRTLPEIIGAADQESGDAASAVFEALAPDKLIHRTDPTSAELAKLYTNVYRYVNFALANEFALLSEYYGSDAHEVIRMVNDRYPRASVPTPGPTGGPCLSKDGYFLVEELNLPDFVLLAWKLNDSTPAHVVRKVAEGLGESGIGLDGTPVAVLGRTFKRDSDDERESPSLRIVDILEREGAAVRTHDPFVAGATLEEALAGARAMVLATNHSFYDTLEADQVAGLMDEPRLAVDCWGALDRKAYAAAGIGVRTFGVGDKR